MVRYKNIGNFEKTGQAWSGVTAGDDDLSLMDGTFGAATGIKTYKDLYDAGLGRYNSLYEHLVYDKDGNFAKDANGNYITERHRMRDGSLWLSATDAYALWPLLWKLKPALGLKKSYFLSMSSFWLRYPLPSS